MLGADPDLHGPVRLDCMLLIGRLCFRAAILAYAGMLIVGAWPYHAAPVIGPPAGWASRNLGKISIRPGMPVFNAGEPAPVEWKLHALCQRFVGLYGDASSGGGAGEDLGRGAGEGLGGGAGEDKDEEPLYTPDCPPTGLQVGVDSFNVMLQRLARASSDSALVTTASGASAGPTRAARRYAALGDWFCRAPEAGGSRFHEVKLIQQRVYQSYESGVHRAGPVLVCRWRCSDEPAPLSSCQQLPADASDAIVGQRSS